MAKTPWRQYVMSSDRKFSVGSLIIQPCRCVSSINGGSTVYLSELCYRYPTYPVDETLNREHVIVFKGRCNLCRAKIKVIYYPPEHPTVLDTVTCLNCNHSESFKDLKVTNRKFVTIYPPYVTEVIEYFCKRCKQEQDYYVQPTVEEVFDDSK